MKIWCLLITLFFNVSALEHEFYFSKVDLNINTKTQKLEMVVHVFLDDLELALQKQGSGKLFLGTEKESLKAPELIEKYLNQKIITKVNDQRIAFKSLGFELSQDLMAYYVYLEADLPSNAKRVVFLNKMLMDVLPDQKNIFALMTNGQRIHFSVSDEDTEAQSINL